jgi:hypothetical protein
LNEKRAIAEDLTRCDKLKSAVELIYQLSQQMFRGVMMVAEQKHSAYLSEAESRLRQLSPERLRVAVAFLTYLQQTAESEVTEKLLRGYYLK